MNKKFKYRIFSEEDLVIEIFRDDAKKTRTITIHQNEISLEEVEHFIKLFKKEIPWDFID